MKDILTRFKNGEFAINTKTQSEYDALMGVFDRRTDIAWPFGYRHTGKSVFGAYRELTSISCVGVTLKCRPTVYYELKGMEVISFNQFRSEYNKTDMVNKPSHYIGLKGLEVEVVLQNFIPRIDNGYSAHRVASAIEYILRSPLKNGLEDYKKARKNLDQVIEYMESEGK